jgi:hypothetical protein
MYDLFRNESDVLFEQYATFIILMLYKKCGLFYYEYKGRIIIKQNWHKKDVDFFAAFDQRCYKVALICPKMRLTLLLMQ